MTRRSPCRSCTPRPSSVMSSGELDAVPTGRPAPRSAAASTQPLAQSTPGPAVGDEVRMPLGSRPLQQRSGSLPARPDRAVSHSRARGDRCRNRRARRPPERDRPLPSPLPWPKEQRHQRCRLSCDSTLASSRDALATALLPSPERRRPRRMRPDAWVGRPARALSGGARTTAITGRSGHESLGGSDSS